jgi:hypothetical protein
MWTDISELFIDTVVFDVSIYGRHSDYMFKRRIFIMGPEYFPPARMREIIDYLHEHDQRYHENGHCRMSPHHLFRHLPSIVS